MSTIRIPTPLRPYASALKEIEVHGETVGAALQDLVRQHPALKPHLYDRDGRLRKYIYLFLNEEDVRHLQGETTALQERDRLVIIPSIAGGSDGTLPGWDVDVPANHRGELGRHSRIRLARRYRAPSLLGEDGRPWRSRPQVESAGTER